MQEKEEKANQEKFSLAQRSNLSKIKGTTLHYYLNNKIQPDPDDKKISNELAHIIKIALVYRKKL